MGACFYRKKWIEISKENSVNHGELKRLSRQVAYSFLDYYLKDCRYEKDYIDLLCEMSTFSKDPLVSSPGATALFGIIVERLCDDFEVLQTETYNRVMAQVISYCCKIPEGSMLNMRLKKFGISSHDDILNRTKQIRLNGNLLTPEKNIKKIILLSRVTIGADIAITSVLVQRLLLIFPHVEFVVIGGSKLKEVYEGNSAIKIREAGYSRRGGLLERLSSWHQILKIIEEESKMCNSDEVIVIDPDSRLSQLGVLPLVDPEQYFFFDSRSDISLDKNVSMPELTNMWFDRLTGKKEFCYPKVWIPNELLARAAHFSRQLRNNNVKRIISINFGVGGNYRKSVGIHFEEKLLLELLKQPGTVILLDKGYGEEETQHTDLLISAVQAGGFFAKNAEFPASDAARDAPITADFNNGVLAVRTSIGEMGALVANSDEYIGYDSACQHIGAALGTPCLTIFAGSNNIRFIRRWSAHGTNECNIVHVDTLTDRSQIDTEDIVTRAMQVRDIYA